MKVRIERYVDHEWRDAAEDEVIERRPRSVLVELGAARRSIRLTDGHIDGLRRIHPDDLAAVRALPVAGKAPKPADEQPRCAWHSDEQWDTCVKCHGGGGAAPKSDAIADARAAGARDERAAIREEAMRRADAATYTDTRRALADLVRWIDGRTT